MHDSTRVCKNCLYWDGPRDTLAGQGVCHYNPPRVTGLIQQVGLSGQAVPTPITAFPNCTANWWCSKFTFALDLT
jgi:hypothetical protein